MIPMFLVYNPNDNPYIIPFSCPIMLESVGYMKNGDAILSHGKIHHAIKNGKPSISIRVIYTMANCLS